VIFFIVLVIDLVGSPILDVANRNNYLPQSVSLILCGISQQCRKQVFERTGRIKAPGSFLVHEPETIDVERIFAFEHIARIRQEMFGVHQMPRCFVNQAMKHRKSLLLFVEINDVTLELR